MLTKPLRLEPPLDIRDIRIFRAENFPESGQGPWLDQPDWRERITQRLRDGELDAAQAEICRHWAEQGYLILPGMFDADRLDQAWREYEDAIASKLVTTMEDYGSSGDHPGRTLTPHLQVAAFDALLRDAKAVNLVSMLLGATALPFQTIAGHNGSQQKAHSDSIHMTTYPEGNLIANWIAFEDIAPDSGPLVYYPGSHLLPYVYSRECKISLEEGRAGYAAYHEKYESHVQRQIVENSLVPHYFHARKGDVLFWHANLLHGGSPIRNLASSRRALVCHYFAQGCVCYHDYTGTPSYLTEIPKLERHHFSAEDYLRLNPDVAAAGVDPFKHYLEFGYKEKRRVR